MDIDEIIDRVVVLDGVNALHPQPGDGSLAVGHDEMPDLIGHRVSTDTDSGQADFWIAHPVYSHLG